MEIRKVNNQKIVSNPSKVNLFWLDFKKPVPQVLKFIFDRKIIWLPLLINQMNRPFKCKRS